MWVKIVIYYISAVAAMLIGKGIVLVLPDVLKNPVSLLFGIAALFLMLAAVWQFGNIWAGRGFCTVLHRLVIIWFVFAVIAVLFISVGYLETVCGCNGQST